MRLAPRPFVIVAIASILIPTAAVPAVIDSPRVEAYTQGYGISHAYGFDACTAPTSSEMDAWWPFTPWYWIGIYIGGNTRFCAQPQLSADWINHQANTGWRFQPIWAGPQAPCNGGAISWNTGTAYQQGRDEALAAYGTLRNLGFGTAYNTPVTYDMEGFNTSDGSCVAAVHSFVVGWVDQLKVYPPQIAGYYGSTCSSNIDGMADTGLDYIWGAYWNGNPNTGDMLCVNPGYWVFSQRLKQYRSTHDETWNNVTLSIDSDCANGPVAASATAGSCP